MTVSIILILVFAQGTSMNDPRYAENVGFLGNSLTLSSELGESTFAHQNGVSEGERCQRLFRKRWKMEKHLATVLVSTDATNRSNVVGRITSLVCCGRWVGRSRTDRPADVDGRTTRPLRQDYDECRRRAEGTIRSRRGEESNDGGGGDHDIQSS